MGLLTTFRSSIVQADFNSKLADFVAKELAVISIIGAIWLWYLFGWQWFFWGIILCPVVLSVGIMLPYISTIVVLAIAWLWSLPFIFIAQFIPASYLAAVLAFVYALWAHGKALTWFIDVSRSDNDNNVL
jgi:hypothetical protein